MSIGQTIYTLRTNHNMTQKELGNIAGVSEKTVSAWEKERIIPRMGPIQKMADFFGIKKSDIIEPIPVTASFEIERKIQNKNFLGEDEIKLVDDYRELNADGKNTLMVILYQHYQYTF